MVCGGSTLVAEVLLRLHCSSKEDIPVAQKKTTDTPTATAGERVKAIQAALAQVHKDYGAEALINLSEGVRGPITGLSTGALSLDEALDFLGIAHLLARWPATLSGGEARRVAIGRALLAGAQFLMMDEPLSFLDAARRDEILQLVERIRDDLRVPILYVTHDHQEARRLATTMVEMG